MNELKSLRLLLFAWVGLGCLLAGGCNQSDAYPSRPITLVCPWAAGGGTDRVSRQMAMLLEQELGVPVTVINATGGKGVTGHSRGLDARPDGYTLTMMTFELNTMHWAGLTDLTYRDAIPLVSVNEDYAALLVPDDSPWQSLQEVEAAIADSPGALTASGTAVGGAWHLALAGWLVEAGFDADDVVWVPSEGSNPSLQQLISGGVDMVCCSLPEARTLLESGQVKALGLMSLQRAKGFEDIPTFPEEGRGWTLGGWRGLGVPKETPRPIVEKLVAVLTKIVSAPPREDTFAGFMAAQKFDNNWRGPEEFKAFLASNDKKLGALLTSDAMKSVSQDRFSPMAYPALLFFLLLFAAIGMTWNRFRTCETTVADDREEAEVLGGGKTGLLWVLGAVVGYILFAEWLGFIIVASFMLLSLLYRFGTRPLPGLMITLLLVPLTYVVFAYGLRVPLPQGLLG